MPTWLKVVLVIVGLFAVLAIAGVIGVVYVAKKYGPGLMEAGKHSFDEGREYGRRTDNEGCVNEAVSRHANASGIGDMIGNGIFMRACLDASRPTPGFCDDVPNRFEFMKSARWQLDECKRYGLSTESQCGQLFQQVQQFCDERGRGNAKGGYEEDEPSASPPPSSAASTSRPRSTATAAWRALTSGFRLGVSSFVLFVHRLCPSTPALGFRSRRKGGAGGRGYQGGAGPQIPGVENDAAARWKLGVLMWGAAGSATATASPETRWGSFGFGWRGNEGSPSDGAKLGRAVLAQMKLSPV